MNFSNHENPLTIERQSIWTDDWAFTEESTNQHSKINGQNMLSSLSNNLIAYQNSYKKQKTKPRFDPDSAQNIKKRKLIRRKINFTSDLQNTHMPKQDSQTDKQNKNQINNLRSLNKSHDKDESGSNLIKLDKMFRILKEFNTLNESILPFKVNLNKVSHKRILANMAFKQFNLQNKQDQSSLNPRKKTLNDVSQRQENRKSTIDTEFVPIKRKVYSLDIREKEQLIKKQVKIETCSNTNHIFSINTQSTLQLEKRNRPFSRRKRSYSVRKPQNYICEKSIEQIRQNYSRGQKSLKNNKQKQMQRKDGKGKENEYFSDSRFFTKRQFANDKKRQGLSEVSVLNLRNCIKK